MELRVDPVEAERLAHQLRVKLCRSIAKSQVEVAEGSVGLGDNVVGGVGEEEHVDVLRVRRHYCRSLLAKWARYRVYLS